MFGAVTAMVMSMEMAMMVTMMTATMATRASSADDGVPCAAHHRPKDAAKVASQHGRVWGAMPSSR